MTISEGKLLVWQRRRRFALAAELQRLRGEGVRLEGALAACRRAKGMKRLAPIQTLVFACFNGHPISAAEVSLRTGFRPERIASTLRCLRVGRKIRRLNRGLYVKL